MTRVIEYTAWIGLTIICCVWVQYWNDEKHLFDCYRSKQLVLNEIRIECSASKEVLKEHLNK